MRNIHRNYLVVSSNICSLLTCAAELSSLSLLTTQCSELKELIENEQQQLKPIQQR